MESMSTNTKQLWKNCLSEIEAGISKANFCTWFKNTSIVREDMGIIYIGVPNEFVRDWLMNKYHKLITKIIADSYENMRAVEYTITKVEAAKEMERVEAPVESGNYINKELPLRDLYINPEDNLNPRYHFNSFIVGAFNELAYAASLAIIDSPGTKYNPFFIYGGTGLGKTHLIQAVGNSIKDKYPNKKVHYMTLEKFATDFINSLQSNKANSFKEKYRKYDLLIIDDIQFIGKMEKIQEYVAEVIEGNIRELEGSLNAIICQYRLKNRPLSLVEVKNLLKNNIRPKKNMAIGDVVKIVGDYYKIQETSIYEKTRKKEIVKARQVVMYLLREDFNVSYPLIGQKLGGKDHTTVIHSCLKIKNDIKSDPGLMQEMEQIRIMFK